jgi:hypothetical protein
MRGLMALVVFFFAASHVGCDESHHSIALCNIKERPHNLSPALLKKDRSSDCSERI